MGLSDENADDINLGESQRRSQARIVDSQVIELHKMAPQINGFNSHHRMGLNGQLCKFGIAAQKAMATDLI